jgi:hypothetical protein
MKRSESDKWPARFVGFARRLSEIFKPFRGSSIMSAQSSFDRQHRP